MAPLPPSKEVLGSTTVKHDATAPLFPPSALCLHTYAKEQLWDALLNSLFWARSSLCGDKVVSLDPCRGVVQAGQAGWAP